MMWRDLLQTNDEAVVAPWVGGRTLRIGERTWTIEGDLPPEHGWYTFRASGRKLRAGGPTEAAPGMLRHLVHGYLVGDRLVPDDARVDPDPSKIVRASSFVHLVEPGLDRFARVAAGRVCEGGSLVYQGQAMPLGPEGDVLAAYLDGAVALDDVRGVPPALDAAFRMETWRRAEAERRRAALEQERREEEARRARQERRRELAAHLGDAAGRRAMVPVDFAEAARAALAVGGAEYLDHRRSVRRGEVVVRFRVHKQRFECTCDEATLRIIDAGICLVDHATGERGDTYFTLESLPAVILEARRGDKLVVFRHTD
jgi:hypothetical protein